jgi:hypothetical protein
VQAQLLQPPRQPGWALQQLNPAGKCHFCIAAALLFKPTRQPHTIIILGVTLRVASAGASSSASRAAWLGTAPAESCRIILFLHGLHGDSQCRSHGFTVIHRADQTDWLCTQYCSQKMGRAPPASGRCSKRPSQLSLVGAQGTRFHQVD